MTFYEELSDLALSSPFEAMPICEDLLQKDPNDLNAICILGYIFLTEKNPGIANIIYQQAVCLNPNNADIWNSLGRTYNTFTQAEQALQCFNKALSINPNHIHALVNKGLVLMDNGDDQSALKLYNKAIAIDKNNAPALTNRAHIFLRQHKWELGWKWYKTPDDGKIDLGKPELESNIESDFNYCKTVCVTYSQGIGDIILFSSCIPLLKKTHRVKMICNQQLINLFRESFDFVGDEIITREELTEEWLIDVDYQIDVASLPRLFLNNDIDFKQINKRYLKTNSSLIQIYKNGMDKTKINIGLSWTGGLNNTGKSIRSVDLSFFAELLNLDKCDFYSLEYIRPDQDELDKYGVTHISELVDKGVDYKKTAAFIDALDLVICVTTTSVHAAGALGKTTIVLNPYSTTFRFSKEYGDKCIWHESIDVIHEFDRDPLIKEKLMKLTEKHINTIIAEKFEVNL